MVKRLVTCLVFFNKYFSNALNNIKCEPREQCMICKDNESSPNCKISNVGYSIECTLCSERNIHVSYEGETARTGYIRAAEHQKEYSRKSKKSVLYRHVVNEHEEEEDKVDFKMKIVGNFNNPLSRIIDESIRIRNKNPKLLLNSKAEFHGPCIKRKVFEK